MTSQLSIEEQQLKPMSEEQQPQPMTEEQQPQPMTEKQQQQPAIKKEDFMTKPTDVKKAIVPTVTDMGNGFYLTGFEGAYKFIKYQNQQKNDKYIVVTVMHEPLEVGYTDNDIYIKAYDGEGEKLDKHFDEVSEKVMALHAKGYEILIHCHQGISRSAAMLIAILMKKNNWGSRRAYTDVKNKRNIISPNPWFIMQLLQYEKKLVAEGLVLEN